ncbi:hypothetical protein E1B28_013244 [Marasmius oreades]|uniref:Glycosyl hydrolase family 88 n=1 Tax=Marasmius oreades TaxID=181124 RepID=A0A9P7RQ58_9AGAR|nr:uncharacterized protein E1B28_013244 [Marasmius oreades]KAG7087265.1 hypothetical protein E1B28_013244 [Marasmius oreades]
MLSSVLLRASVLVLGLLPQTVITAPVTDKTEILISKVKARLAEMDLLSWEIGTYTQALLELDAPEYSTLTAKSLPLPRHISPSIQPVLQIVKNVIAQNRNTSIEGPQPIMPDGSAGDPASIGPAVLLAEWTKQSDDSVPYLQVAEDEINYLFSDAVPKTTDGAISHRVAQLQLWNDNMYMLPPFFAQYGVQTQNVTMIEAAYKQISTYRSYCLDLLDGGLWKHVVLGGSETPIDLKHWATGLGWVTAGLLRVWSTVAKSEFADQFAQQQNDLMEWVKDIHEAVWPFLPAETHVFTNYVDIPAGTTNDSFPDAASGTLLAATAYRLSVLTDEHKYVAQAEKIRKTLFTPLKNGTYLHFSEDGWLQPVVDPHWYSRAGEKSAEGQAFVLMMHAAHRDWVNAGRKGDY